VQGRACLPQAGLRARPSSLKAMPLPRGGDSRAPAGSIEPPLQGLMSSQRPESAPVAAAKRGGTLGCSCDQPKLEPEEPKNVALSVPVSKKSTIARNIFAYNALQPDLQPFSRNDVHFFTHTHTDIEREGGERERE